ncbi:MAG TPA: DNA mismatch repair endonuclease MutL [Terriglobales bacterium]|nr:DNA mismatch repair endonuclease MutL [Terriglobales bacterium]
MARIHVLPEHVANKIAAGEVVERPASVVKELLENALDAGSTRIRVVVEGGGKKLIQITDNGCGMVRDDAMLAFERHATSKLANADDLLNIATLGFRGEALPSIASVSRLRLETRAGEEPAGTVLEIAGGKLLTVEEAGLPLGTSITIRDLFFNTPARKKFLKAESTELSHIASLVTHYALAHPDKHFELHNTVNAMLVAPPVRSHSERIYQVFGRDTLDQLIPLAAETPLERTGLPQPPPWVRARLEAERIKHGEDEMTVAEAAAENLGVLRAHGFVSKPEIQKLNRNSIYIFVNGRLIRDRLILHALTEAYRNIIPPTVFPVVLLFLEMPFTEVDVNVHPSKTEVRFRQQSFVHDFVRESVRAALMKARPVPQFTSEIHASPTTAAHLTPGARISEQIEHMAAKAGVIANPEEVGVAQKDAEFSLRAQSLPPINQRLGFGGDAITIDANAAIPVARVAPQTFGSHVPQGHAANGVHLPALSGAPCGAAAVDAPLADDPVVAQEDSDTPVLATLRPLGQVRDSFILAVNGEGLWIIDQHVAHERILFEKVLQQRSVEAVDSQRMLMPLIVELTPAQHAVFAEISHELHRNGFDAEPFGTRTIAVKTAPAGIDAAEVERMLHELLDQFERERQAMNIDSIRREIAASIACHAAIKINTPLPQDKMEWLLRELAATECPMSCPHGRPVVLRYSVKDIQRAFKRI